MHKAALAAWLVVILAVSATAENLITRIDGSKDAKPFYSLGLIDPKIEVWGFWVDEDHPTIEIGRLWPVEVGNRDTVLLGGYVSRWGDGNFFIEPLAYYERSRGKMKTMAMVWEYIPTESGPHLLKTEASVALKAGDRAYVGLMETSIGHRGSTLINFGPCLDISLGRTQISVRYLPWGSRGATFRAQISQKM